MPLKINRDRFNSLQTRQNIAGSSGIREIQLTQNELSDTREGFLGSLIFGVKDLIGFISQPTKLFSKLFLSSATQIASWFIEGVSFLYEFNWDISDEQIDKSIENLFNQIQTKAFGILGKNLGSLVSVGLGSAVAFYINPLLARLLVAQISDELFFELIGDMTQLLIQVGRSALTASFLTIYKSARSFLKEAYKNPNIAKLASKVGITSKAINGWGDKQVDDWSFSAKEEKFKESIKDDQLRNNIEEFIDEAKDGASNTLMSMGNIWDAMQLNSISEPDQTLIYQPDRSQSEQFYVHGSVSEIRSQVMSINTITESLSNRDIGQYIVTSDDQPIISNNGIEIELTFYMTLDKPWGKENRKKFVKHSPIIPNIDKSKFTWEKLTEFFTPIAFTDGDYFIYQDLDNGRQIVCRGKDEQEALKLSEKLLYFTEAKPIGTPQFKFRDGNETDRWKPRKKQAMYLSHFYIRNYPRATKYEQIGRSEKGKRSISQRFDFKNRPKRVNFDLQLREAFSSSIDQSNN